MPTVPLPSRETTEPLTPVWLIVTPFIPRPDQASGDRRLMAMLEMLRPQCSLQLVALHPRDGEDATYADRLAALGVEYLGMGRSVAARALLRQPYHAVLFEFHHVTPGLLPLARRVQPQALMIVDSVDVHFLREREAVRLGKLDATIPEETRFHELLAYRRADVTIVVSSVEASLLVDDGVHNTVVIPNIVPLLPRTVRKRSPSALFVGSFDHAPNGDAVHWFRDAVWPSVRGRVPEAQWLIAGSRVPPDVLALDGRDGVQVVGFVPSTYELLDRVQVSVAPLTFGGGMKGKVSEALAAGVPVVTTKWGAQGLEAGAGTAFLLADDPDDFASAVVALMLDEGQQARMGDAGRELARRLCSAEAAAPVVQRLVERSRATRPALGAAQRWLAFASFAAGRGVDRLRRRRPSLS